MKKSELRQIIRQTIKEQISDINIDKPFPDPPPPPPPPPGPPPGPYPGGTLDTPSKGTLPEGCNCLDCNEINILKNQTGFPNEVDWQDAKDDAENVLLPQIYLDYSNEMTQILNDMPPIEASDTVKDAIRLGHGLSLQIQKIWDRCCQGKPPKPPGGWSSTTPTSTSGAGPGGWTDPGPAPGAGGWPGAWPNVPLNESKNRK